MTTVTYSVPSIHCEHCVHTVQMEVSDLEGVSTVQASLDNKQVVIGFDEPATEDQIKALLAEINYPVVE